MSGFFKINTKKKNFWLFLAIFDDFSQKKPELVKKNKCCVLIHHFSVLNSISFNISVHFSRDND